MLIQKTITLVTDPKKQPQQIKIQATKVVPGTVSMAGSGKVQLTVEFDPAATLDHTCNFWVLAFRPGSAIPAPSVGVISNGPKPILICSDCWS